MPAEAPPTVLSGFSGVGGLDLGLEAAGFTHVGCIEMDEVARRSLKANRDDRWPVLDAGDILDVAETLRPTDVGLRRRGLTLLAGAPPCQPFSKAAQWSRTSRIGLDDERSDCLHGFLDLAETFLPKAILLENVTGFAQGAIAALPEIERSLAQINARWGTHYRPESRVIDAASFGVPQRRRRAIIVALRDGGRFFWPTPTHDSAPMRAWDAIGRLPVADPPVAVGKWADLLPSIPEGENYLWHTSRGGGRPLFGYRTRYWSFLLKLAKDLPAWTLPAQPGPSTGPFHWDNRPLAVEELLRLQSLPADWAVDGNYRDKVRQVGNATPALLAEVVGRAILSTVQVPHPSGSLRLAIPRLTRVPKRTSPEKVSPAYRSLEGNHPDHPGAGLGPKARSRNGPVKL
jgi:DNA (cytosine-5)-methyltransferase 1